MGLRLSLRTLLLSTAAALCLMRPDLSWAASCQPRTFSTPEQSVNEIYIAYYGRPADVGGLAYWAQRLAASNGDLAAIIEAFGESAEYDQRFGALTATALVTNLYRQLFGRDPDSAGLSYYVGELESGRRTLQAIALDILNGAQNDDALIIANRREVAGYLIACLEQAQFDYPPIALAVSLLSGVGPDSASVQSGLAQVEALIDQPANQAPIAADLSLIADPSLILYQTQLVADDPDGDLISYQLRSPSSGAGYAEVRIGSETGRLYLTLDGSGSAVQLQYQATDGLLYSDPATVSIEVREGSDDEGLGADPVDPLDYASFAVLMPWGTLLGTPGDEPVMPTAIDLSPSFPRPGNQGGQGSCVGWATGYALKSYLERIDQGWELDRLDHVFSPAYIFNPIALDNCEGTYISEALIRMQTMGAATWSLMPYTDTSCSAQPSAEANQQAAYFRIRSWGTLRSLDDVKAQLANRRPVIAGIEVYPSLYRLSGSNPVYTDYSGNFDGGHAVTLVGYDDNRYGGAFKVINSWGTNYGDQGFFWLPYSAISAGVVRELYSVEDISQRYDPLAPVEPIDPAPLPPELPNLEILSWSATYDPRPGGAGTLEFEVVNSGTATAPAGAYVNLMLSADGTIGSDDIYLIYEPIPFELSPGEIAYRDASNQLHFYFPGNTASGTYQMALWVDDLDQIAESNENDNVSFGDNSVFIAGTAPDLTLLDWHAGWTDTAGALSYSVVNQGLEPASGGWHVSLILSRDQVLGNADDQTLIREPISQPLASGESVYRSEQDPLHFTTSDIPSGDYWMALSLDDGQEVSEADESNNSSWGWEPVSINAQPSAIETDLQPIATNGRHPVDNAVLANKTNTKRADQALPASPGTSTQYNGRRGRLSQDHPTQRSANLRLKAQPREKTQAAPAYGREPARPTKSNRAKNPRAFPVDQAHPMPSS